MKDTTRKEPKNDTFEVDCSTYTGFVLFYS